MEAFERELGLATLGAGVATLLLGALSWGGGALGTVVLLVQLVVLAAALGTALLVARRVMKLDMVRVLKARD